MSPEERKEKLKGKVQCVCGLWYKNKYTLYIHKKSYKHKIIMSPFIE